MKTHALAKRDRRSNADLRARHKWPLQRRILEYTGEWNLGLEIRHLHRLCRADLLARIAGHGVTPRMWPHLWALFQEDGLSQIELARRVNMEGPSVVTTLNMLEQHDLVKRVPNDKDRRVMNVHLTGKAKAMRRVIMAQVTASNEQRLCSLTDSEVAKFFSILRKIRQSFEQ